MYLVLGPEIFRSMKSKLFTPEHEQYVLIERVNETKRALVLLLVIQSSEIFPIEIEGKGINSLTVNSLVLKENEHKILHG